MTILRCAHCGTANREGSNFCNRCGTALHPQAERQDIQPESTRADSDRREASGQPAATPPPTESEASESAATESANELATSSQADVVAGPTEAPSPAPEEPLAGRPPVAQRLVAGIPGLLEPIRLASNTNPEAQTPTAETFATLLTVPAQQLRQIRGLVTQDPILIEHVQRRTALPPTEFRLTWLIVLLLLAVGLPILLSLDSPSGEARQWSGVAAAHAAVNELPSTAPVWILWAYDPATAGEMDLVMEPLTMHLLEQGTQVQVISLLPTGLATARRHWERVTEELLVAQRLRQLPLRSTYIEGAFLPGGAAALALLAKAPATAMAGHTSQSAMLLQRFQANDAGVSTTLTATVPATVSPSLPALTIVVSADAEDVQQWLEIVQPLLSTPVVAVTAAGADPLLRPYLASGQLVGLVSGFDGAISYQQLRGQVIGHTQNRRFVQQLVAQNWGHIAIIALLILGNFNALWFRRRNVSMGEGADEGALKGSGG